MGSQRRILKNTEEVSSLLSLRDELYENTLKIIELVRDRIKLAEEIGREKASLGLSLRNHDREMEVMSSIPGLGDVEKTVLNMIFELTILNEMENRPEVSLKDLRLGMGSSGISLSGPNEILSYTTGLIVSFPGFILQDNVGVPENLALGVMQKGGHITSSLETGKVNDLKLRNSSGEELVVLEKNTLNISPQIFAKDSRNEYMEAV